MSQPVGLDVLQRLATGYTREERELLKRQQAAQRQQMDTGYRAQTPGYNEYASAAAREMVPMAAGAFPVLGEAVDASMGARALQEGRYGDAALHGAGLALPFASGPMLNAGLGMAAGAGILAGKGAKTADLHALSLAEQMAEQGADAGKIWEETGWWVPTPNGPMPPGGAPRYEIPDPLPNVPLKRVTPAGAEAAVPFEQRAKVMKEAADLRDFAEANKLSVQETLAQMKELGFDMPSKEAIQQAMMPYSTASMKQQAESAAMRAAIVKERPGTLGERLPHPELYEAYPQLKDMDVRLVEPAWLGGARGRLDPTTMEISIDRTLPDDEVVSTLLHETQHGVQDIEPGFSKGGTAEAASSRVEAATTGAVVWRAQLKRMIKAEEEALKRPDLPEEQVARLQRDLATNKQKLAEFDATNPPLAPGAKDAWEGMTPFEQYRHLGGEAEARLVQNRQKMREPGRMGLAAKVAPYATPEQKRKAYPWTEIGGLDVPLEYLIP
jgi:hypothetical protein